MEVNIIEVDIKSKDIAFNIFNENQISDEMGKYIFQHAKKSDINSKLIINIDNKVKFNTCRGRRPCLPVIKLLINQIKK